MAVVLTIGLGLFWNFAPQIDMGPFNHELTGEKGIRVSFIPNPPGETDTSTSPIRNNSPARVLIRKIRIPVMVASPASGSQRSSARDIRDRITANSGVLITIDISDTDNPHIVSSVPLEGDPVTGCVVFHREKVFVGTDRGLEVTDGGDCLRVGAWMG